MVYPNRPPVGWMLVVLAWVGSAGASKANSNSLAEAAVVDAAGSAASIEPIAPAESEQHAYFHAQRDATASHEARRKLREWASASKGDEASAPAEHEHGDGHHHDGHQCIHDLIMYSMAAEHHYRENQAPQEYDLSDLQSFAPESHRVPRAEAPETDSPAPAGRKLQSSSSFSRIRIHIDTSAIDARTDVNAKGQTVACYSAGQPYTPTLAQRQNEVNICEQDDILTAEKKNYLVNTILVEAVEWFEDVLSVRPVSGNLKQPSPMFDEFCYDDGWIWYSFMCCEGDMPDGHQTTGVADTDFVLYITARPTGGATLAWALTCQSDQYSRPISGHANFSPARISTDPADKAEALSTAIHEIAHALGFSSSHFALFRKPGTLEKVDRQTDVIARFSELGKSTTKLVTAKTVAAVKDHFGCSNWPNAGAELEDGGSSGTAGSHLEKRIFSNEFMTGTADPNSVYSAITMAIFEDSGWYAVSYSRAEKLAWGFKQGCDFVRKTCGEGWSNEYFCGRDQTITGWQEGCTPERRYRAKCNLATNPFELLPEFQYFDDKRDGGTDLYSDYCPFFRRLGTGDCQSISTIPFWYYGERVGGTSKCFTGTFQRSTLNRALTRHSACLQAACGLRTNLLEVTLVQGATSITVNCPSSGGPVDLAAVPGSGFTGILDCPASSSICTGDPCDVQTCNGHGRCNSEDGTCACDTGYIGATAFACDMIECPGKQVNNATGATEYCSGRGTCNFELGRCETPTGLPGCDDGWRQSSGSFVNDCGEKGCPLAASTLCSVSSAGFDSSGRCECAGRGNCTQTVATDGEAASVCACPKGWSGAACELRDCPGEPRCGGTRTGTCDADRGVCICGAGVTNDATNPQPVFFTGPDCGVTVEASRPFPTVGLTGELRNNATDAAGLALDGGGVINIPADGFRAGEPEPGVVQVNGIEVTSAGPNAYGAVSLTLPGREYRFVKFFAPAADVPITLEFTFDAVEGLDAAGVAVTLADAAASTVITASYADASSGVPNARTATFNSTLTPAAGTTKARLTMVLEPGGSAGVGGFSQAGWIRVAMLAARAPVRGRLSITRDACSKVTCVTANVDTSLNNGGQCRDGQCPCARSAVAGGASWSGQDCSVPSCPGSPPCGGQRGVCMTPAALEALGETPATRLPVCRCTDPTLYAGRDCSTLTLPSGTLTPGLRDGQAVSTPFQQFNGGYDDDVDSQGGVRGVLTASGTLEVGQLETPIVLDPSALQTCCGFTPGATTVHVTLDAVSMPGRSNYNVSDGATSSYRPQSYATASEGIPDPVLLTRTGAVPSIDTYDNFDNGAWASLRPVHETIDRLSASDIFFISAFNGRYATARLEYEMRVEIVSNGACPTSISRCSGHAADNSNPCSGSTPSSQSICECIDGWEGSRCDIPAPPLLSGDVVSAEDIVPGSWRFFVFRVPEATQEVIVRMQGRAAHSSLAAPALVVAWESSRDSTRSLPLLQGATAIVDYDAFAARNASQTLVLTRNQPTAQRYLYIGAHNAPRGTGPAAVSISVDARSATTLLTECPAGVPCPELCSHRGEVARVNDVPQCFCDFGWRATARCASPQFASLGRVAEAAQQMGFLCSLCESSVDLPRDGMSFFKVQRPLQRGTALQLDVGPPPADDEAASTSSSASASLSAASPAAPASAAAAAAPGSVLHVRRPQSGFSAEMEAELARVDAAGLDVVDVEAFDAGGQGAAGGDLALARRELLGRGTSPAALWVPAAKLERAAGRAGLLARMLHSRRQRSAAAAAARGAPRSLQVGTLPVNNSDSGDGAATSGSNLLGNPSLLVADALPRSILDFVVIRSSSSLNETIVLTDGTTDSSSVWVTLYAQTEGRFRLGASRAELVGQPATTSDFFAEIMAWLLTETTGQIVFFSCIGLISCMCVCCVVFGCCPGARSRVLNQAEIESQKAKRELATLFKSTRMIAAHGGDHPDDDAEATGIAKLRAVSRRLISSRALGAASADAGTVPGKRSIADMVALSRRGLGSPAARGAAGATGNPMHAAAAAALRLKRKGSGGGKGGDATAAEASARTGRSPSGKSSRRLRSAAARSARSLRGGSGGRTITFSAEELMALPEIAVDRIPPPPRRR